MGSSKLVSPTLLRGFYTDICGADAEVFSGLCGDCVADARHQLQEMMSALGRQDWATLCRAAHSLKSNFRTFGSEPMADLCFEIESAAEAAGSGANPIPPLMSQLQKDIPAFCEELELGRKKIASGS